MAYSTHSLAINWLPDDRLARIVARFWPLPLDWLDVEDLLKARGVSMSGVHVCEPPIGVYSSAFDGLHVGFDVDRIEDEVRVQMYARMEPITDDLEWWSFTDSVWKIECATPLRHRLKWIERTQEGIQSWYERVILREREPARRVRRSPAFEANREAVAQALAALHKKTPERTPSIPDVHRELTLQVQGADVAQWATPWGDSVVFTAS